MIFFVRVNIVIRVIKGDFTTDFRFFVVEKNKKITALTWIIYAGSTGSIITRYAGSREGFTTVSNSFCVKKFTVK